VTRTEALPEFSTKVYEAIGELLLRCEDGFSDVVPQDIASKLDVSVMAVNAAIGHLIDAGLVETEDYQSINPGTGQSNPHYCFLYTDVHPR